MSRPTRREISEVARQRVALLRNGVDILTAWEKAREPRISNHDVVEQAKRERAAASAYNRDKIELARAVSEVTTTLTIKFEGSDHNVVHNAMFLTYAGNTPFLRAAVDLLEAAAGEWERIEDAPHRYGDVLANKANLVVPAIVTPSYSFDDEVEPGEGEALRQQLALAPVPPTDEGVDPETVRILAVARALTFGQATGIVVAIAGLLAGTFALGYWARGLKDSVALETENAGLKLELMKARADIAQARTALPVQTKAAEAPPGSPSAK